MKQRTILIIFVLAIAAWVALRDGPRTRAAAELPGSRVAAADRATYLGRMPAGEHLEITISLRLRDRAGLEHFLDQLQDPVSPFYQQYLTMDEFAARYSPSDHDHARVIDWLRASGFTISDTWPNRLTIGASGTVADVESAFGVTMNRYLIDGRPVYAAAGLPSVPVEISHVVDGVIGLDSIHHYRTYSDRAPGVARPTFEGKPPFGPPEFQRMYGLAVAPGVNDGLGQHIAVILWHSNINTDDLKSFWAQWGIDQKLGKVRLVPIDSTLPPFGQGDADGELALDVQYASSFTAYSSQNATATERPLSSTGPSVTVYLAKNSLPNAILKAEQRFLADAADGGGPRIASLSFGTGELTYSIRSAETAFFMNAAAIGRTVCVASGDSGAYAGSTSFDQRAQVSWPASSPYVLAVGGTSVTVDSSTVTLTNETVWKNRSGVWSTGGASTGGGSSQLFSKPSWQTGPGIPGTDNRHVPDIALDADPYSGYAVLSAGEWQAIGGTSASTPSIASFLAGVNQQRKAAGKGYLGQVNAAIYELYRDQADEVYRDITDGNNAKYKARPGYDRCTGVGSIRAASLADALVARR